MTDMVNSKGWFKGMPRATRDALRDGVLDVIDMHSPTFIFTVVDKQRHVARYGASAHPPENVTYMHMIERSTTSSAAAAKSASSSATTRRVRRISSGTARPAPGTRRSST
jgi:hypothetical protein